MFRKPRDGAPGSISQVSVGRAPTPPPDRSASKASTTNSPSFTSISTPSSRPMAATNGLVKRIGSATKKPNGTITNFFKRVERQEESLFIKDTLSPSANFFSKKAVKAQQSHSSPTNAYSRHNENGKSIKRRRLESFEEKAGSFEKNERSSSVEADATPPRGTAPENTRPSGPFFEYSDSDDEEAFSQLKDHGQDEVQPELQDAHEIKDEMTMVAASNEHQGVLQEPLAQPNDGDNNNVLWKPPSLRREPTSIAEEDEFGQLGEFMEDEFPEQGEEQMERRWMEEQIRLEREFEDDDTAFDGQDMTFETDEATNEEPGEMITACPMCNATLNGLSSEQASVHVNGCLDGKPVPLPSPQTKPPDRNDADTPQNNGTVSVEVAPGPSHKRFMRTTVPRPGQANPMSIAPSAPNSSAFSKLMSSHAEDTAWATAAANEVAARGKPAFKRTCPFYKILPGFSTCVDAFRYGAVEGCKAYFLSHFHSDHYIGLTASWCHGPIYCSRVTGNLVRQQLRVDPKWVVDLEWEKETEVPDTGGLKVVMIPANHCPGSSLYLFEKIVGSGPNPRKQRVLHCGDFRACPMHVNHPLLRPNVQDAVTGKTRQQKLDVCYLDTTYLTPKYAFPSQEAVIQACADMCVSLSKDHVDRDDKWEQAKAARAGSGMVQFLHNSTGTAPNPDHAPSEAKSGRGRLLVVVGTYSIGKERICLGIARALRSKIYAAPGKRRICAALDDPEIVALLTTNPSEAQVHMQMLMEIRAETLAEYLRELRPHGFARVVGFRPSGWNYRPPGGRLLDNPPVERVLHSAAWKPRYVMQDLVPQRGSTREASCFGVPYSEHSSFRELSMFCCALRIDKVIPTVNVGSAKSREKMKGWIERWAAEKKKNGLFRVEGNRQTWD